MTGSQLRLKQPTGWFAAGRQVAQALSLLSDGAFKLFMWICLNADRGLGAIQLEPSQVARVLGKTEAEIRADLRALFQAEIGQPTPDGAIQIADCYWPYERAPTGQQAEKLATYINQLKRAFLAPRTALCPERFHCRGRENCDRTLPCRRGHRRASNTRFCRDRFGSTSH
jgi:hypothetical protein